MNCDKCQTQIPESEAHDHCGHTLCDDCFMDELSPFSTPKMPEKARLPHYSRLYE